MSIDHSAKETDTQQVLVIFILTPPPSSIAMVHDTCKTREIHLWKLGILFTLNPNNPF